MSEFPILHLTEDGFRIEPPAPKQPASGERFDKPQGKRTGKCYICGVRTAAIWLTTDVPKCCVCHDRYRRRE